MKFMLDTDSVSYALRGEGHVAERILEHVPSDLCVSALTIAELRFGAERQRSRKLHRLIDAFLLGVAAVPFDDEAATIYGRVASGLMARGTPIGQIDAMLAAHALHLGVVMVTRNLTHFRVVPRLRVESWYE